MAFSLVMGVLNVTPDSFSDGGRFFSVDGAVDQGRRLAAAGAGIVDVGGESTRPGADPVEAAEELRRVLPVVAALAADGIRVSIDTRHAEVAEAAVAAGATIVNDVSAGELIHELALAEAQELRLDDLAGLVHIYPTLATSIGLLAAESVFDTAARIRRVTRFIGF